jgi:hypothetical protein
MSEPRQSLALDPAGHWAVAYGTTSRFVQNPNELVLFDLTAPPNPAAPSGSLDPSKAPNPVSRTIRSYAGTPQQLIFTGPLQLPGGAERHLLIIETDVDVSLLDLDDAFPVPPATAPSEITVQLTSGATATTVTPAGVSVYPGDRLGPARIALRASDDRNIFTLVLGPPDENSGGNGFTPTISLTDVGGIPSDVRFVQTDAASDGGLRVAALVPSTSSAVLIEPDTSLTTSVSLPVAYSSLSLVTNVVGAATPGVDVALLWGASSGGQGVALWTLGTAVGTPYRSVEVVDVQESIQSVADVPQNDRLKVLQVANAQRFYVLDLVARTAAPLVTNQAATLVVAPDGGRMWAFVHGGTDLASIDFKTLNPIPLTTDFPISAVFDVQRSDNSAQRSLIAIHNQGAMGATVFDALAPDTTTSQHASALLLEGP